MEDNARLSSLFQVNENKIPAGKEFFEEDDC